MVQYPKEERACVLAVETSESALQMHILEEGGSFHAHACRALMLGTAPLDIVALPRFHNQ